MVNLGGGKHRLTGSNSQYGDFLIVTEDSKNAIAQSTTLNRSLCAIADLYPVADVIEQLASIFFERRLEKTAEALDASVDVALEELQKNAG